MLFFHNDKNYHMKVICDAKFYVEFIFAIYFVSNLSDNHEKGVLIFIIINVYEARMRAKRENRQGDTAFLVAGNISACNNVTIYLKGDDSYLKDSLK